MKAVEKYYSVQDIALLLSRSEKWVLQQLKAKAFGSEVVNLGSDQRPDYRTPASGLNGFIESRRVFLESEPGVAARTVGELKRKSRSPDVQN